VDRLGLALAFAQLFEVNHQLIPRAAPPKPGDLLSAVFGPHRARGKGQRGGQQHPKLSVRPSGCLGCKANPWSWSHHQREEGPVRPGSSPRGRLVQPQRSPAPTRSLRCGSRDRFELTERPRSKESASRRSLSRITLRTPHSGLTSKWAPTLWGRVGQPPTELIVL